MKQDRIKIHLYIQGGMYMKKSMAAFVAASFLLASSPAAIAADGVKVEINGQVQTFEQEPIIDHGVTLVPMRSVFETLGATVTWDESSHTVTAEKDNIKIQLAVDSPFALKNGTRIRLSQPAKIINDRVMVPLRFVAESLGADVQWDQNNRTVLIFTNSGSAAGNSTSSANNNVNPNIPVLTFQKATDLALSYSYTAKNAQQDIDRAKEVLNKAADNVKYVPAVGSQDQIGNQIYAGYAQANVAYQMAQKEYGVIQDTITYQVKTAYNAVLQALEQKRVADLALQNALLQNQIAQFSYNNGTISEIDQSQKNNDVANAKASQEAADKAVADAYQKLNQLLGLPQDARPQLIDTPQMSPLGNVDLEGKVAQVQTSSPSIWLAEQNVDIAQLQLDLYTFNNKSSLDTYKAKQIDVTKAQNTAADLRDQLGKSVRTLYYNIRELEDQYQALQAKLASAEQTLKKTQALYDNGMAIQADLVAAQLQVESLKQQLQNIAAQHDNALMAFDKPWVLIGQPSSSNQG